MILANRVAAGYLTDNFCRIGSCQAAGRAKTATFWEIDQQSIGPHNA